MLLADLVARLTASVPPVSGVPSTAQYIQAVKDAVADLSRRASVPRVTTLAIVAGTASYDLPADFQQLIRLSQIGAAYPAEVGSWELGAGGFGGGTLVTPAGLVPFSGVYREQITITGDQLTIYPTPQTSADRTLVYAAGDALNEDGDAYPTLTEDRAAIALLLAQASCIERLAGAAGASTTGGKVSGLGYSIDGSAGVSGQRAQAQGLRTDYLNAVASLNAARGGLG